MKILVYPKKYSPGTYRIGIENSFTVTPELEEKLKNLMAAAEEFTNLTNQIVDAVKPGHVIEFYGDFEYLLISKKRETKEEDEQL